MTREANQSLPMDALRSTGAGEGTLARQGSLRPLVLTTERIKSEGSLAVCETLATTGLPVIVVVNGLPYGRIRRATPWEVSGDERGSTFMYSPELLDRLGVRQAFNQIRDKKVRRGDDPTIGYIWQDGIIGVLESITPEEARKLAI